MTTEYHDDLEEDSTFWTKEASGPFPEPFRLRRWMCPAVTAAAILALVIALGASSAGASNRLWILETSVWNLTESLRSSQQLSKDAAKDVQRLKFAVESNSDQLSSVAEALKDLATLDSLSRTVTQLKCSLERIINNGSVSDGCCPLRWDFFGRSCYFFSEARLSWAQARDWCEGHESHLLILANDKQWDFVIQRAARTFYWVGLTDERSGKWEWVNQTPYVMDRRRWRPGQPDSWTGHGLGRGDEDCAHLHEDGRLNDLHCLTPLRFVCQRPSQRG